MMQEKVLSLLDPPTGDTEYRFQCGGCRNTREWFKHADTKMAAAQLPCIKQHHSVSEMTRSVKVIATSPDDLGSIIQTYIMEEGNQLLQAVL